MIRKKLLGLTFSICFSFGCLAQIGGNAPWMQNLNTSNYESLTFEEITATAEAYWADRDTEARGSGFKPYKRWESQYESYQNPNGTLISQTQLWQAWREKSQNFASQADESDWQSLGPIDFEITGSWSAGQGRVNVVAVDPSNEDIFYIGSPAGGVWKTTDAGATWEPLSDFLPQIGVSAIAVDPNDSNIVYIGTGDDDGFDTPGVGILKSTDGGQNWVFTGLNESNAPLNVTEIYIHPTNTQIVWASTFNGLFKSTNGGDTWSSELGGNIRDLKVKPGDPNTLYAVSSTNFFKSTDGGDNWSTITNGTPTGTSRLVIDVTPANPEVVYILAANQSNGFEGIYKSSDSATSFALTSGGLSDDIFEAQQAWYDLALAVSDTDENEIYTGVLNVWKSTDSGAADSFSQVSSWFQPESASYTHADIHMLRFFNGKLYCGSDGGIYVSDNGGTTFDDRTEGIAIGQFYNIETSPQSAARVSGGLQDNGGYELKDGVWQNYYGADGMDVAIDPDNSDRSYGFIQFGQLYYTNTGGAALVGDFNGLAPPASANFVARMEISDSGRLYGAFSSLYELDTDNISWTQVSSSFGQNIDRIALDPSNDDIIYVTINETLRRSDDGGQTFTIVNSFSSNISSVTVNSNDSNIIYVTLSGTNGAVFKGTFSGDTLSLENITGSLPVVPKRVIKHQPEHPDNPLFLGTSLGVWRYDDITEIWEPFENNLPNVPINDLEINAEEGLITAGTFGRGIWQSPIPITLGVSDVSIEGFSIFPNPSKDVFNISWNTAGINTKINIVDITGKLVRSDITIPQGATSYVLDMKEYTTGIYFLELTLDGATSVQKIIKQ